MKVSNAAPSPLVRTIWRLSTLLLFLAALGLLLFSFSPFETLEPLLDALTPDGQLESFTPASFHRLSAFTKPLGFALLLLGVASLVFKGYLQRLIESLRRSFNAFSPRQDFHHLLASLKSLSGEKRYLYLLLAVTATGFAARLLILSRPMGHDESYTFLAFASRPLRYILTDYHLPNNHVFHSLLVHLAYKLLGNHPWVVRLPAFLAGVALVPATYWVAKRFYDRPTALLSASLVAATPNLINFSTTARGYTLVVLFSLLILGLGDYLKAQKNCLAWLLFIALSVLGFYTTPVMLYAFGGIFFWLLVSALFKDLSPQVEDSFLRYLIFAAVAVALLTLLLYLPIFIFSGLDSVIGHPWAAPLPWADLWPSILARVESVWRSWNTAVPPLVGALLAAGFLVSLLTHRWHASHRIPLIWPVVLWLALIFFIQRLAPLARYLLFLLPLFLISAAAGLVFLFTRLIPKLGQRSRFVLFALLVLSLPLLAFNTIRLDPAYSHGQMGNAEGLTVFLQQELAVGDSVLVTPPMRIELMYYFSYYGMDTSQVHDDDELPEHVARLVVVVRQKEGETLASVLEAGGLTAAVDLTTARPLYQYGYIALYALGVSP